MSNNRMPKKPKQVRSVKQDKIQPQRTSITVTEDNAPILTVKLLNVINENLIALREEIKNGRP